MVNQVYNHHLKYVSLFKQSICSLELSDNTPFNIAKQQGQATPTLLDH